MSILKVKSKSSIWESVISHQDLWKEPESMNPSEAKCLLYMWLWIKMLNLGVAAGFMCAHTACAGTGVAFRAPGGLMGVPPPTTGAPASQKKTNSAIATCALGFYTTL